MTERPLLVADVQHEELRTAVEEIVAACRRREDSNPHNEPGKHEVPSWILVDEIWAILKGLVEPR